jgi:hypothetical protein
MAAHTPGPWTFETPPPEAYTDHDIHLDPEIAFWIADTRVAGEVLASVHKTARGEHEPNARLMAAAPELLAALRSAVDTIRSWQNLGLLSSTDREEAWALYQQSPEMQVINAALAKAEPEAIAS